MAEGAEVTPIIIYHRNCWDGFTAAWVAHRALGGGDLHAAHYGEPPPDVSGRDVYVVDFSYPRAMLDKMAETAVKLVVLDHHKTAEDDLRGHPNAVFDQNESGASLAWRYFHPGGAVPALVQYVRDRDLWLWELPDSREVSEYLRLFDFDMDVWDRLAEEVAHDRGRMVASGESLRMATKKRVQSAAAHPVRVTIRGVPFLVSNATTDFSEVAGALSAETGAGAAYFHRQDGRVQFSLRSEARTVDVAEVAKTYGGGGHAAAAGFDVSLQGFLGIMGGADERQTGNAYQWCCAACGGGTTEHWCSDCGASSFSVCVPGWFGEHIGKEYPARSRGGREWALREVKQAIEDDAREERIGPRLAKLLEGK